jgi:crotonobetainyl-CoA:carnitine CoA-transferase CaiB-like acyl-CoA transferase
VVNITANAANDPQAIINNDVTELDCPSHGKIRLPGFPVTISARPVRIYRQAPEFGEHTEQILIDLFGLNWREITRLREKR